MELILFSIIVAIIYLGLSWFTLQNEQNKLAAAKCYFGSSTVAIGVLATSISINLFWSLFVAALLLAVAQYIYTKKIEANGVLIRNGAFGGFWLSIPAYAYLATTT